MDTLPAKRLYRSRKERVIAGVCGGLAEYYKVDPTWVRLAFILLFFVGGCALLIYSIMWMVVPLEPN
jgi:phage shock protein C